MTEIIELLYERLQNKEPLVLATIMQKHGSAPREEGTKMLIGKDSLIEGSVGGGLLEAKVIEAAASVYTTREAVVMDFELTGEDALAEGMLCGGNVKIILEYLDPEDKELLISFKKAWELCREGIDFAILTKIPEKRGIIKGGDKSVFTKKEISGDWNEQVHPLAELLQNEAADFKFRILDNQEKYMLETFCGIERVCIVGAGHIAQKMEELLKFLGFYTVIMDDRKEFANSVRFSRADEVVVLESFDGCFERFTNFSNTYIVIMTRGHTYDQEVLVQALKTDAKYIGMIGSTKKKNQIFKNLEQEGHSADKLARVHCPVGIDIYAQTPEEIAVSIAAELIKARRGPRNG